MPKISELPVAATPLFGTEELACVQNGITVQAKSSDLANVGLFNFALTGEVKSVVGQPLVTVIDKSINATWFGAHIFNAGLNIGTGGVGPGGSTSWFDSFGNLEISNIGCYGGGGYYLDENKTLLATNGYTFLLSQNGIGFGAIAIGKTGDLKNYYRNNFHSFENVDGSSVYMHADATGVGVGTDLGVSGNLGVGGNVEIDGICEVDGHLIAERLTVGTPPSTDTGPGDIYLVGGIGVGIGVVGASGTVNVAVGYYVNGDPLTTIIANMIDEAIRKIR